MFGTQFLLLLTSVTLSPCWPFGSRHSRLLIGSPFADAAMTSAWLADACHVRCLPRVCDRSANHTFNEWLPLCRRGNVEPTFKKKYGWMLTVCPCEGFLNHRNIAGGLKRSAVQKTRATTVQPRILKQRLTKETT